MSNKKIKTVIGTGLLTIVMHSFCCILPLVVFLGGFSSLASTLIWIEPFEPYLLLISAGALGYSFYAVYKPKPKISCECENHSHHSSKNTKIFLWVTTAFTITMYYLHHFTEVLGHSHVH